MGRQPFLTRLAFGRSPFEPSTSATRSSEYVQLDSTQQDTPLEARAPNSNRYIQLFDERGDAVNPRAHQYGRQFRRAQNDVLSSIGFLARRQSSSEGFPGTYDERLSRLEREDSVGNTIDQVSTMTANVCTWWIGSLRDRILTFHMDEALSFSQIIASEYRASGTSFFYNGIAADDISTVALHTAVNATQVLRPLDRFLVAIQATQKTKSAVRQWMKATRTLRLLCVEVLFFPLVYHSQAQRLGLYPESPLFPPWGALVPFSSASPLRMMFPDARLSTSSTLQILTAIATSPVFLFGLEIMVKRWIANMVDDAMETSVICPDNSDMDFYDATRRRGRLVPGRQPRSQAPTRRFINKIMVFLGWSEPLSVREAKEPPLSGELPSEIQEMIDASDGRIVNTSRLAMSTRTNAGQEGERQLLDSPTASNASQDGNDPRIRITARGGVVEMEVQLPPRTVSSHAEFVDFIPNAGENRPSTSATQGRHRYHRVTKLSVGPARRLGAMMKRQIVGWIGLPLRLLTLGSMAAYCRGDSGRSMLAVHDVLPMLSGTATGWRLRWVGILAWRVGLCGGLQAVIDLGLWGVDWMVVTWTGKAVFRWGAL